MIEKLDSAVFSNDCIVFGDLNSHFVTFFSEDLGPNSIILIMLILMMNILIIGTQKFLIILDFWNGITKINNVKHLKRRLIKNCCL